MIDKAHKLYIVGAGPGAESQLTAEARGVIAGCRYFAAGKRLLGLAPGGADVFAIGSDLQALRSFVDTGLDLGDVCVIASGDPGCFSIMPFLKKYFQDSLVAVPGISAMQLLSSRLRLPWQDWELESVHGRSPELVPMPAYARPTLYFCDDVNPPQAIAGNLPRALAGRKAAAGAALGLGSEELWQGTLGEAAALKFPGNSVLLVFPEAVPASLGASAPGIPDDLWLRTEGVPLSKSEVRSVLLSKARPRGRAVIWDSGAGTGSYGIESALLEPRARVYSIDKNSDACDLSAANARRFGAVIETVCGEAPACYDDLPRPDLLIIGGNDGRLDAIFGAALAALVPGGRIVVTALLEETKKQAHALFAASGLSARAATRVVISRGESRKWVENNPVIIFTGDKPEE